jgi:hypothetical protein
MYVRDRLMKWLRLFNRDDPASGQSPAAAPRQPTKPKASTRSGGLTVSEDSAAGGSPYETHSWETDPVKGLRRVEDAKTVRRDRGKKDESDPYNTGGFRKGW